MNFSGPAGSVPAAGADAAAAPVQKAAGEPLPKGKKPAVIASVAAGILILAIAATLLMIKVPDIISRIAAPAKIEAPGTADTDTASDVTQEEAVNGPADPPGGNLPPDPGNTVEDLPPEDEPSLDDEPSQEQAPGGFWLLKPKVVEFSVYDNGGFKLIVDYSHPEVITDIQLKMAYYQADGKMIYSLEDTGQVQPGTSRLTLDSDWSGYDLMQMGFQPGVHEVKAIIEGIVIAVDFFTVTE